MGARQGLAFRGPSGEVRPLVAGTLGPVPAPRPPRPARGGVWNRGADSRKMPSRGVVRTGPIPVEDHAIDGPIPRAFDTQGWGPSPSEMVSFRFPMNDRSEITRESVSLLDESSSR